jgi:hypothetical protein
VRTRTQIKEDKVVPSSIEVLQVSMMSSVVKCKIQVFLHFGYGFEEIRLLESLHICVH